MKNDFERLISRLATAKEIITELEGISIEVSKIKMQKQEQ